MAKYLATGQKPSEATRHRRVCGEIHNLLEVFDLFLRSCGVFRDIYLHPFLTIKPLKFQVSIVHHILKFSKKKALANIDKINLVQGDIGN